MSDTWSTALLRAVQRLRAAGVPEPQRDARRLLAHALDIPADRVTLHLADPAPPELRRSFERLLRAREGRRPVSQIVGHRLFWGRRFFVTDAVLDPRPETEILVREALGEGFSTVLDLGTGSGAILLSLLADRGEATGVGIDISQAALDVARRNAVALGVSARATFRRGDWFDGVSGRFDLIVSNPPYIAEADIAGLAPEVRDHEPRIALSPGGDGLDAYRRIAAGVLRHLAPGARLLVEIGPTQGAAVAAMLGRAGLDAVQILPDLDGRDRVVAARRT